MYLFAYQLSCLLVGAAILRSAGAACVPDFPAKILADPLVLRHGAVQGAFERVTRQLAGLYGGGNVTRDGLSFAIVHASSGEAVFRFNNGTLKWYVERVNETSTAEDDDDINKITSDSIFRVMSVSKNIAVTSALVVEHQSRRNSSTSTLTLDTPVRFVLPQFHLPERDWNDGGSEITLNMLASHTSGLPRESFSTDFNLRLNTDKADLETIGAGWAGATPEGIVEEVGKTNLMFAPGQRAAYSNAGISILASAVVSYYNSYTDSDLIWSQLATREILAPLNMTHSFFGAVPDSHIPDISVPGGENWADLIVGVGYDPAAGMWSSANDLVRYLHGIWLQPVPSLIASYQRRRALKPAVTLPDGKQQVGPGWEIELLTTSASSNASDIDLIKTYAVYGKSGNGGGWQSWIDVVPNLGYGLVVLAQASGMANYTYISPSAIHSAAHEILVPAFAEALSARMAERFAGLYSGSRDSCVTDRVGQGATSGRTYARLEVESQILYLRELVVNGTNALEAIDRLGWSADTGPRLFSTPQGVVLDPAEGAGETAAFGEGAQVFRMMIPGLEVCDWFDYDGYKGQNGWPVGKVVVVERGGVAELHYPPFEVVVGRV